MHRLILSAPFGNRLSFPHATSTLGTFTARPRGGVLRRLWRVLRTVRYYRGIQGWKNRLGLPNPGIDHLAARAAAGRSYRQNIISVAGHNLYDWHTVVAKAVPLQPQALELNLSCPNCPGEDRTDYAEALPMIVRLCQQTQVIAKLPPVGYMPLVRLAADAGVRSFHCCNTLPTPGGGLSGKPLQPLSLQAVRDVGNFCHARGYELCHLIGGGGVTALADARRFLAAGASHVAVGSVLFFPWRWPAVRRIAVDLAAPPAALTSPPVELPVKS